MSRKRRHPNARRRRRERLREREAREVAARRQACASQPPRPPRLHFLGKARRGDAAEVDLDFRDATRVEVDFESAEDPAEAAREAVLVKQWVERGHETQGSS
jgi:hypothetical protein